MISESTLRVTKTIGELVLLASFLHVVFQRDSLTTELRDLKSKHEQLQKELDKAKGESSAQTDK